MSATEYTFRRGAVALFDSSFSASFEDRRCSDKLSYFPEVFVCENESEKMRKNILVGVILWSICNARMYGFQTTRAWTAMGYKRGKKVGAVLEGSDVIYPVQVLGDRQNSSCELIRQRWLEQTYA